MTRVVSRRSFRRATMVLALALAGIGVLRHAGTSLVVARDVGPPDAVVMLASHEWERLPAAAALARLYPSSVVLLTVPRVVTRFNCHLCGERVAWLEREGVAASRIIVLPDGVTNTYDEARATRHYLAGHPLRAVLVVTSPYHTRRALHVFEHVLGSTGAAVGVVPATGAAGDPARWWMRKYDRWYVAYEWAALLEYRVKYGVGLYGE